VRSPEKKLRDEECKERFGRTRQCCKAIRNSTERRSRRSTAARCPRRREAKIDVLSLWRRHTAKCQFRDKGRAWTKCSCPVWIDGEVNGERIRCSADTRDWKRAGRRAADFEEAVQAGRTRKRLSEAATSFLDSLQVRDSTRRKYDRVTRVLMKFAGEIDITWVDEFTLEKLDGLRGTRNISLLTWSKELEVIRQFFRFCLDRKWIEDNPSLKIRMPRDPQPEDDRIPYSAEETERIFAACDSFGRTEYERVRARAMVTIFYYYAPRISDVALLEKSHLHLGGPMGDAIFFRAQKNGNPIWLPLYPEVKQALERLPLPRRAARDCKYFFWHGFGSRESYAKTVGRTLEAVYRESGVEKAISHRFRHTLVNKILAKGGTFEDAATILGDSPAIIRKHYHHWSVETQARTVEVLQRVHGTNLAHGKNRLANPLFSTVNMVAEEGVNNQAPLKTRKLLIPRKARRADAAKNVPLWHVYGTQKCKRIPSFSRK
jgi:integrase